MFEEYCDYCHKPIKKKDYMVHLRYPTFRGIKDEYYHSQCYYKIEIYYNGIRKKRD